MVQNDMIVWYKHLYYKNHAGHHIEEWKKKIEKGKIVFPIFCICLASNPCNLLDIMNVNELLFSYYQKRKVVIIGLAANRTEAMELVAEIVEEVYTKTGDFDIRGFVEDNQNDREV